MRNPLLAFLVFLAGLGIASGDHDVAGGKAPLFDNLGNHHHKVTTSSKDAQKYFDQGLILCFAFNHPEAIRSFQEAARFDPGCAMAYWGIAFAYGANINMPMSDEAVPKAYAALGKAQELAPKASKKEQAYVAALAKRYAEKPAKDRAPLDRAFADSMRDVSRRFPDDLDAATLFAEALMDTMPWSYWTEDGKPKPETEEVLATLESVMKRRPDHVGACHFYIHAVEASPNPDRGLPAAHRLRDLVPGSGHLVHMPSHIYLRLGDYHEASRCNERAIAVDADYIARYKVKSPYATMYYNHNIQFLSYSTSMEGRSADSIRAARKASALVTKEDLEHMPMMQWVKPWPLLILARFGHWDEVLAEPQPANGTLYETAMGHYARGLAFVRKGQRAEAEREAAGLNKIAQEKAIETLEMPTFPGASLVRIAGTILTAEVVGLRGEIDSRLRGLHEAVAMQDKIPYMEPAFWYFPVRQLLGAALVQAGRFAHAEKVYREDLRRLPENGWSIYGLLQCLRAQGKTEAASDMEKRFREAWKHGDAILTASCF